MGARKGRIKHRVPLPGAHKEEVVVGPDGSGWVAADRRLAEISFEGALASVRRSEEPWSPSVGAIVGPHGGLVAHCRERGPLTAPAGSPFPSGMRPRRDTLDEATLDASGDRLWTAWKSGLRGVPLRPDAGIAPATIDFVIRAEQHHGPPRPAFGSDGTVFLAEADRKGGVVRAIDPASGSVRWSFTSDRPAQGAAASVAVASSGTVVLRIGDTVYCLDSKDGKERWQRRTHVPNWWRIPSYGLPAPTIGPNGVAIFATTSGLEALDVETGEHRFMRRDLNTALPVAIDRTGVAHVAIPGRLVGVRARDGETVYEVSLPTEGDAPGPPSIGYHGMTLLVGKDEVLAIV